MPFFLFVVLGVVAFAAGLAVAFSIKDKQHSRKIDQVVDLQHQVKVLEQTRDSLTESLKVEQWRRADDAKSYLDSVAETKEKLAKADRLQELLDSTARQFSDALAARTRAEERLRYMVDARAASECLREAVAAAPKRDKSGARAILLRFLEWAEENTGVKFGDGRQRMPEQPRGYFLCYNGDFEPSVWKVSANRGYDLARPPTVHDIGHSMEPVQLAEAVLFVHPSGDTYVLKSRDRSEGLLPAWSPSSWRDRLPVDYRR